MDLMQFVNIGMVVGVVTMIQIVKRMIDAARRKATLAPVNSLIWFFVLCAAGIIMAIIAAGIKGTWNWWQIACDAFIYASAANMVYRTKKAAGGK